MDMVYYWSIFCRLYAEVAGINHYKLFNSLQKRFLHKKNDNNLSSKRAI